MIGRVAMLAARAGAAWMLVTVFSVAETGATVGAAPEAIAGTWWSQIFLELRKLFFGQVAAELLLELFGGGMHTRA